jgi:hypothetical protein
MLAGWRGRWFHTYSSSFAGATQVLRMTDEVEGIFRREKGTSGLRYEIVPIVSGSNPGRNWRKWEFVISRIPPERRLQQQSIRPAGLNRSNPGAPLAWVCDNVEWAIYPERLQKLKEWEKNTPEGRLLSEIFGEPNDSV